MSPIDCTHWPRPVPTCNTSAPADSLIVPGTGILYIAPVTGPEQIRCAKAVGLREVFSPVIVRVEGDNRAGLAARLTREWALADISFTGLTMTVLGPRFIGYAAFDSPADANKAATILAEIGTENAARQIEDQRAAVLV